MCQRNVYTAWQPCTQGNALGRGNVALSGRLPFVNHVPKALPWAKKVVPFQGKSPGRKFRVKIRGLIPSRGIGRCPCRSGGTDFARRGKPRLIIHNRTSFRGSEATEESNTKGGDVSLLLNMTERHSALLAIGETPARPGRPSPVSTVRRMFSTYRGIVHFISYALKGRDILSPTATPWVPWGYCAFRTMRPERAKVCANAMFTRHDNHVPKALPWAKEVMPFQGDCHLSTMRPKRCNWAEEMLPFQGDCHLATMYPRRCLGLRRCCPFRAKARGESSWIKVRGLIPSRGTTCTKPWYCLYQAVVPPGTRGRKSAAAAPHSPQATAKHATRAHIMQHKQPLSHINGGLRRKTYSRKHLTYVNWLNSQHCGLQPLEGKSHARTAWKTRKRHCRDAAAQP